MNKIIHIEYCVKWNYFPEFERVSNIIKKITSDVRIESNKEGNPRTGSFEVTINGKLKYSRLQTNQFPTEYEIKSWLN